MENLFSLNEESVYKVVCKLSELKEGIGKRVMVGESDLAIFLHKGVVYAVDNLCPHQHAAIMYDGFIEEDAIVCPAHGWKFNLNDGKKPDGCKGLTSHPVEIANGNVLVKVIKKELKW